MVLSLDVMRGGAGVLTPGSPRFGVAWALGRPIRSTLVRGRIEPRRGLRSLKGRNLTRSPRSLAERAVWPSVGHRRARPRPLRPRRVRIGWDNLLFSKVTLVRSPCLTGQGRVPVFGGTRAPVIEHTFDRDLLT